MDESRHHLGPAQYCVIDRGTEIMMEKGDLLNIYRQKRINIRSLASIQVLLGSLVITSCYNGASMGISRNILPSRDEPTARFYDGLHTLRGTL